MRNSGRRPHAASFAIKTEIREPRAKMFAFAAQKTMYGGKHIAKATRSSSSRARTKAGPGLIASGVVTVSRRSRTDARDRSPDAAREHHDQADGVCKAPSGTDRTQAIFELE